MSRTCNVLFLCTGNSARSILGEALLNHMGRGAFRAYSAGSQPKGEVHPMALQVLEGVHISTEGLRSNKRACRARGYIWLVQACEGESEDALRNDLNHGHFRTTVVSKQSDVRGCLAMFFRTRPDAERCCLPRRRAARARSRASPRRACRTSRASGCRRGSAGAGPCRFAGARVGVPASSLWWSRRVVFWRWVPVITSLAHWWTITSRWVDPLS